MAKQFLIALSVLGIIGLSITGVALAKGELAMARIAGPGLENPIQITDSEVLSILNPWRGEFADWGDELIEGPPEIQEAHRVLLFAQFGESTEELEPIYLIYYHPNVGGEHGLVYVPGPGEAWYAKNIGTIFDGREGEWHPARPALDDALRPLLTEPATNLGGRAVNPISMSTVLACFALLMTLILANQLLARRAASSESSAHG